MDGNSHDKGRLPKHKDTPGEPYYDLIAILEDGTEAAKVAGLYYPMKKNGKTAFDRPIRDPK